ncbi:hypothetical protein D3C86_2233480 [compost metagenome]
MYKMKLHVRMFAIHLMFAGQVEMKLLQGICFAFNSDPVVLILQIHLNGMAVINHSYRRR